jgi:hypothetical protein
MATPTGRYPGGSHLTCPIAACHRVPSSAHQRSRPPLSATSSSTIIIILTSTIIITPSGPKPHMTPATHSRANAVQEARRGLESQGPQHTASAARGRQNLMRHVIGPPS